MKTIPPETETEAEESDFKPLTAQEAQQWRSRHPPLSVWKVVAGQALVGMLVALVAWVLTGRGGGGLVCSLRCPGSGGSGCTVCPRCVAPQGVIQSAGCHGGVLWVGNRQDHVDGGAAGGGTSAGAGLELDCLAVGMVVAMKTYWVALLVRPGVRKTD